MKLIAPPKPEPGPLAKRIAAAQPQPEKWQPAWLRHLQAKDMSGRLS